jgi:polysaccharide export outer membrane protein
LDLSVKSARFDQNPPLRLTQLFEQMGIEMRFLVAILALWMPVTLASAQTLKSGDSLSISVLQDPKLDRQVIVDPSGQIAFPLAGHIRARGLTPQALENILKSKLASNYKDENLDVTVALVNAVKPEVPEEDLKPKVFVTGEIIRPGSYVVRQRTTLMQAIALAGGLGPFAAKNRIQVRRRDPAGEQIFVFNYRAYEAGADLEGNVVLHAGDVIMVPERGLFE